MFARSKGLGVVETADEDVVVDLLFQGTLILLLFTDASALHFASWRKDAALPGRLLGIGLPLMIGLTTAMAALLLHGPQYLGGRGQRSDHGTNRRCSYLAMPTGTAEKRDPIRLERLDKGMLRCVC